MNYLKTIIEFQKISKDNGLTSSARSLYYALLEINNSYKWAKSFKVSNSVLQNLSGIKHRNTFDKSRQTLIALNLIKYVKGNSQKAPTYSILDTSGVVGIDMGIDMGIDVGIVLGNLYKYKYKYKCIYIYRGEEKMKLHPESDVISKILSSKELAETFNEFMANLVKKGKKLTDKIIMFHLETLKRIENEDERLLCLKKSVANKWLGIYQNNKQIRNSTTETPSLLQGEIENIEELYE